LLVSDRAAPGALPCIIFVFFNDSEQGMEALLGELFSGFASFC
jgi:hypothetical protein